MAKWKRRPEFVPSRKAGGDAATIGLGELSNRMN
jgi:hypothetical protein